MNAPAIWKRLLWKEFRQAWPVFALAFVAPPLCLGLPLIVPRFASDKEALAFVAVIGVPVAIALWVGTDRKRGKHRWQDASAALPAPAFAEWCVTILAPAALLALAGAWLGLWGGAIAGRGNVSRLVLAYGAFFPAFFVVCCFITGALRYLAPFLALIWGAWFNISVVASFGDRPSPETIDMVSRFNIYILLVSVAASFAFSVLLRDRTKLRYAAAAILAIVIMPGPYAGAVGDAARNLVFSEHEDRIDGIFPPDRSFMLRFDDKGMPEGCVRAVLEVPRMNLTATRGFRRSVRAIGVVDQRRVFLARQLNNDPKIAILEWDTRTGKVRTLASFTTDKRALEERGLDAVIMTMFAANAFPGSMPVNTIDLMTSDFFSPWGHVSPSGQYVVLKTRAVAGLGDNLWLVNLRTGKSRLVLADAFFPKDQASWADNKLVLSGAGDPMLVDLIRGATRPMSMNTTAGEARE